MPLSIFSLTLTIIIIITSMVILFLINFYRDPERKIPEGNNIVSPADGKVISILRTGQDKIRIKKGYGKIESLAKDIAKECFVISIFMNPFDVHVNRAPVGGKIESVKHTKGKFFAAYDLGKSLRNEKNEVIIRNKVIGKVKIIQVAGFLARRIICSVRKSEKVNKGQKIGRIVLSSQVTLIVDAKKIKLKIRKGQRVEAGSSMIAAR